LKQVRALMGGVEYCRKFLLDLSERIRPLTALLRKGAKYVFTPAMEVIVPQILAAAPPFLVFPDWDAVPDAFHVYCDACIDGFGAALKQEQPNGSVRPTACIGRPTFDSERHWTPLDLEAGSIVWAVKRLRGYLCGTKFRIISDHKALESMAKVGDHNARVQRWLQFLTAFNPTLEYRKGNANGNADSPSRLPEPATEHDRSGSSRLNPVEDGGIFLIRACGLRARSSPTPGVWVGWCPAVKVPSWVDYLSPLRIFAIFAHTGHV
ncbi:ribonuclease H family protein, partial [Sulfitobacter sp.]|uniref:Ty3/Gypsy family RNase HI domain-containing protein n=1 Tax=Sulfitobacter sp. TaxID=1903071 RepID=UPI0032996531